ncbi:alanine racemase [Cellulomonas hominis]|jgi:DNA-binding LacI/PurR family transcriptional regulator|uniref:Alanine racemase n=1 Tax=Cellulomonas hominis TaxID=156981 RepID=A0A511F6M2_9CELL|nr:LacI family DNA-binding transcriptional regulator [Cellulomonas hominis]MBB5474891.1 DNA-binding LacI/PurR family transcriptional regulator [Cellulomonas hominis]GEL44915.1 alanine racemase [Cellulomonas hominis]
MDSTTRPTLESVAQRAGVSRQTVSNVLNAPHLVRPETTDRVRSAIDALGYRPSAAARQLRTGRSRVVGLRLEPVQDGINGAVLDRFLHALTESAQARGYRVMLFTAPDDEREIAQYGELLDTADLDAFVLTSTHRDDARAAWLAERDVPFVTFGRPWSAPGAATDDHPWVDVDGSAGTRAAVEHLRRLGHERIAYLGWPDGSDVGEDRAAGWAAAMVDAGHDAGLLRRLHARVPDGVAAGAQAIERVLADAAPTAVVCASDSLALGALTVGRSRDTPLAVVGFDDTPVAAAVGLTSVAQPLTEAAHRALDLLLDQLDGTGGTRSKQVLLAPHLVERASSRTP